VEQQNRHFSYIKSLTNQIVQVLEIPVHFTLTTQTPHISYLPHNLHLGTGDSLLHLINLISYHTANILKNSGFLSRLDRHRTEQGFSFENCGILNFKF